MSERQVAQACEESCRAAEEELQLRMCLEAITEELSDFEAERPRLVEMKPMRQRLLAMEEVVRVLRTALLTKEGELVRRSLLLEHFDSRIDNRDRSLREVQSHISRCEIDLARVTAHLQLREEDRLRVLSALSGKEVEVEQLKLRLNSKGFPATTSKCIQCRRNLTPGARPPLEPPSHGQAVTPSGRLTTQQLTFDGSPLDGPYSHLHADVFPPDAPDRSAASHVDAIHSAPNTAQPSHIRNGAANGSLTSKPMSAPAQVIALQREIAELKMGAAAIQPLALHLKVLGEPADTTSQVRGAPTYGEAADCAQAEEDNWQKHSSRSSERAKRGGRRLDMVQEQRESAAFSSEWPQGLAFGRAATAEARDGRRLQRGRGGPLPETSIASRASIAFHQPMYGRLQTPEFTADARGAPRKRQAARLRLQRAARRFLSRRRDAHAAQIVFTRAVQSHPQQPSSVGGNPALEEELVQGLLLQGLTPPSAPHLQGTPQSGSRQRGNCAATVKSVRLTVAAAIPGGCHPAVPSLPSQLMMKGSSSLPALPKLSLGASRTAIHPHATPGDSRLPFPTSLPSTPPIAPSRRHYAGVGNHVASKLGRGTWAADGAREVQCPHPHPTPFLPCTRPMPSHPTQLSVSDWAASLESESHLQSGSQESRCEVGRSGEGRVAGAPDGPYRPSAAAIAVPVPTQCVVADHILRRQGSQKAGVSTFKRSDM